MSTKPVKLTDLLEGKAQVNEANYVKIKNPKAIDSADVVKQVKAFAEKGIRSKDIQPQFMFTAPKSLLDKLMGKFQKAKSKVYFDIDRQNRESAVNEVRKAREGEILTGQLIKRFTALMNDLSKLADRAKPGEVPEDGDVSRAVMKNMGVSDMKTASRFADVLRETGLMDF